MNANRQTENLKKIYDLIDKLKLLMRENRVKRTNIMKELDNVALLSNRLPADSVTTSTNAMAGTTATPDSNNTFDNTSASTPEPKHAFSQGDFLPLNVINILITKYGPSLDPETVRTVQILQTQMGTLPMTPLTSPASISNDTTSGPAEAAAMYDNRRLLLKAQNKLLHEINDLLQRDNGELISFLVDQYETQIQDELIEKLRYSIYVNNMNFLKFFANQYTHNIISLEVNSINRYMQGIEDYDELLRVSNALRDLYGFLHEYRLDLGASEETVT
ncbi:hypothetical protein ACO0QE_003397 [Hanseniaspora vineae]